jgi:hypothetical protein
MNARKFLNVRVGLTVTALALSGAMVLAASCAGNGGSGGSSGNNGNGGSSSGNGGSSSGNGGSSGSNGGSSGGNGGSSGGGTCSAGADSVCFAAGQASGAMTGYGWIALGSLDSVSSPVCAPDATDTTKTQPITKANACPTTGSTVWSNPDKGLCISGDVPALAATPDYTANWGVQIGVNANETEGGTIAKSYSTIALSFAGTPSMGLRAEIHIKGQDPGTTYCADAIVSGKDIKLSDFNTTCWGGTDCKLIPTEPTCKQLLASDLASPLGIDKVGIQVSSTGSDIPVKDLCLTGIQFK